MIAEAEKQRRQRNWDEVVASIELECGPFIHNFDGLMKEYINGEITFEESQKRWDVLSKELMKHAEI